jgi:hypothetical protein
MQRQYELCFWVWVGILVGPSILFALATSSPEGKAVQVINLCPYPVRFQITHSTTNRPLREQTIPARYTSDVFGVSGSHQYAASFYRPTNEVIETKTFGEELWITKPAVFDVFPRRVVLSEETRWSWFDTGRVLYWLGIFSTLLFVGFRIVPWLRDTLRWQRPT